jgi:exoribonuclease-2
MNNADSIRLAQIAERAMVERGFLPRPPPEALKEAAAARQPAAGDGLRDLRQLPWSSIDNPESRDLDQIEAIEEIDGGTRLYVGIADVDFFVARGSAIDGFAGHNTTSVYTGIRTFPMLPDRLSYDLSSLVANQLRPSVVIETSLDGKGEISGGTVYRAWVTNRAKLDYPSVSAWLEGQAPPPEPLAKDAALRRQLESQDRLAQLLGQARKRQGALDVETPEMRAMTNESGELTGLSTHHQDRAGRLIEELMIASNRTVARTLDAKSFASIRRVVKEPERWARIVTYAAEHGFELPAAPSSIALSRFVDQMREKRPADFPEISLALVKLMGRGEYVAHRPGAPEIGHFGLATDRYTHATAPNRRLVDLVTQRLVKALVNNASSPYSFDQLSEVATHATEREAAAEKVERRVNKSAAALLLLPRIGQTFEGIVTGASEKGTYVRAFSPAVEGKVVHGGKGLLVGQRVRVRLRSVDIDKGFIDFEVI